MLLLQVLQGPDKGRQFELPAHEPQLIGRSSEALPITDTTVSRRHSELTPDDGTWFIRDLESANGTYVNGRRIRERTRLEPGDQFRCGSSLFLLTSRTDGTGGSAAVLLEDDELDVTIERTSDPNDDSMVLASPDPVRAAVEHLRIIEEITRIAAETLERDELLERVMDVVFAEIGPDRGFVLMGELSRESAGPMEMAVMRYRKPVLGESSPPGGPVPGARRPAGRIPVSRTIIRHVRESGEGVLSTNAMHDDRFASGDSVQDYGIRSAICVPITTGERIFGVMHVDSQLANFTFTDQQLRLLRSVGRLTGLALRSIELVEARVRDERLAVMGQTVASLSHSIKNILQGLRGGADAVELALNKDDLGLAREGWPILARNLDRILNLTMNMLAYSRETGVDIEMLDLADLIDEARELIQRQCDARRIALIVELDEHMPPVPGDPAGLHQVLMNLLMNAAEAAPPRRGVITLRTEFLADEQTYAVHVSDNGPGMDGGEIERAFEPFATTKGQRGTGLGLAVSRKIARQHGGRVVIDSTPGEGTTVSLVLPSGQSEEDPSATFLPREERDDGFAARPGD
ncbi:MAG: ATP-binding protein [Phycisphaerales bacterium]